MFDVFLSFLMEHLEKQMILFLPGLRVRHTNKFFHFDASTEQE